MDTHETEQHATVGGTGDVSVLYVGGDTDVLETLDRRESIDVTAARAASEARERLARNGLDCVVSRYDIPDTDGVAFLETVRERRPRLPLILLAEEANQEIVAEAVAAGVTDCLDPACAAHRGELLVRRVRDAVTARHRVPEVDLVEETERLARTGGWELDPASGSLRVTAGCRRLHGLEGEVGMDSLVACYHPDDQQTLRTALIRAKEATDEVIVVTDEATIETVPTGTETGGQVYLPELRLHPDTTPDRTVEMRIESVTRNGEVVAIRGAISDATDRRHCEKEVQRYERVADELPVGLFRATPDGEFVSVNRTLVAMLGADSKVHLHDAGTGVLAAEDERLTDRLDVDGTVETDPVMIETMDGQTRWVELTLSPAERDGVRYVDGVVRDVTARRRRLRRLERSERRYRALAENLPNGAVLMFDTDLRYRFAHGEAFSNSDTDPEDFAGAHVGDVFEGEVLETKRDMYEATLAGDRQQTEMDYRGRTYEVYTVPVRDENDEVYAGFVMTQDVTERTEREQRLEATRNRMEFALGATDSYIYEIDLETDAVTRHGAFERIHGVDSETVPTPDLFYKQRVHPEDREKLRALLEKDALREQSGTVSLEYRIERDDGDIRWLHTEAYVRTGPDGDPEGLVGLATDVTERKRHEEQLQRQNERLNQFANVVSHDLSTPLSVASGHLELLEEKRDLDSEHVERALEAIERSDTLVTDLLALSRDVEAADDDEPVAFGTVVERAWRGVDADGATLVTDTTRTIRADRGLLRQLVTNLVRNAVEHGSTSPRSQAHGDAVEGSDESVTVTVGDFSGGFYVADDGTGIPPEQREDIFEMGYSTDREDTGYGLAIVREIARAHGWEISVTESEHGGARFEITGVDTVSTDESIEDRLERIDDHDRGVYEALDREPGTIREIAKECDLPASAVCEQIETLDRHGLVTERTLVDRNGTAYSVYEALPRDQ